MVTGVKALVKWAKGAKTRSPYLDAPLYKNSPRKALHIAARAHQQFENRLKQLPKSMEEVKQGFSEVDQQCFARLPEDFPPIITIRYKNEIPKSANDIEIKVNNQAIKQQGYAQLPDCSWWREKTWGTASVGNLMELEINPQGYQDFFSKNHFTQLQAQQSALAIEVHERTHLDQLTNHRLVPFKNFRNNAEEIAFRQFESYGPAMNAGAENQFLNDLFASCPKQLDEAQQYLSQVLFRTLQETQAIKQGLPLSPRMPQYFWNDLNGSAILWKNQDKEISWLHRIFDETLAKYKELGFD